MHIYFLAVCEPLKKPDLSGAYPYRLTSQEYRHVLCIDDKLLHGDNYSAVDKYMLAYVRVPIYYNFKQVKMIHINPSAQSISLNLRVSSYSLLHKMLGGQSRKPIHTTVPFRNGKYTQRKGTDIQSKESLYILR